MTPAEAAALLEIAADSTLEQIEARFLELRRKLEDKIAKAPTPGLQAKYRASLAEITTAFETLTLAADSSTLPVLKREVTANLPGGVSGKPTQTTAAPSSAHAAPVTSHPKPAKTKDSHGKERPIIHRITGPLDGMLCCTGGAAPTPRLVSSGRICMNNVLFRHCTERVIEAVNIGSMELVNLRQNELTIRV